MRLKLIVKPRPFFAISASLLFADQLSKYIVRQPGGFYICNKNLAFDLEPKIFIYIIALILVIFWLFNSKATIQGVTKHFTQNTLYISLIFSGAISNIIDRLTFGCVIDFIDLKFWPVFNLADIFIVLGAIILIVKNINLKK